MWDAGCNRANVVKDLGSTRQLFAENAAVTVRAEREAAGRLEARGPAQTTVTAKGVFTELDSSASQVALTPTMVRRPLLSRPSSTRAARGVFYIVCLKHSCLTRCLCRRGGC